MGTWSFSSVLQRQFIFPLPAQMRMGRTWYGGTADAIYQNIHLFEDYQPSDVAVFGADHVYKMDVHQMLDYHRATDAFATVAALPIPVQEASQYGVIQVDDTWRVIGFEEKPRVPTPIPGNEEFALISMGNYIFKRACLEEVLKRDARTDNSSHDFGRDILPALVDCRRLFAYNFHTNKVPGMRGEQNTYWRDVGTIPAYFEANMDLRRVHPDLNLYTNEWPIRGRELFLPPAKFVHNEPVGACGLPRVGHAINSFVCEGCIVSGAVVDSSVLGPSVRVHSYSTVVNSILLEDVDVGERARLRNVIIDKHVRIAPGDVVGYDRDADEKRGYIVVPYGDNWITVIPKVQRYRFASDDDEIE
jgi:glucose-1-phosphate adenylyltransferase